MFKPITHVKDFGFNELEIGSIYMRWIFSVIKPYLGRRVLEVGSGLGQILAYFDRNKFIIASDVNDFYLSTIKKRFRLKKSIRVVKLNIEHTSSKIQAQLVKNRIDTIVGVNVLEHIEDDNLALSNLYAILRKNGRLILFLPAIPAIYGSLDEAFGHYRRYTKHELIDKLEKTGFHIGKITYFNFIGIFWWIVAGKIFKVKDLPSLSGLMLKFIVPFLQKIESNIPIPIGQSLIVVARK